MRPTLTNLSRRNAFLSSFRNMWTPIDRLFLLGFVVAAISIVSQAQESENVRFTQGDVNESATLSLNIPLMSYSGRGLDLPVALTYSSDVWRMEHLATVRNYYTYNYNFKHSVAQPLFSERSASGWRSTLGLPKVEFPKHSDSYTYRGKPAGSGGPCGNGYRVASVTIHMPDGSSHQLRKSDTPHNLGYVDKWGTFYAVDGSRLRFDANGTDDTGTIFMPDGTRYVLAHPVSQIIDRHGNTMSYDENNRTWTDTLGRVIGNPLPDTPTVGDQTYNMAGLAGVNNGIQTYILKWRYLSDSLTPDENDNTPSLRTIASHYLPYPEYPPTDQNIQYANYPQAQPTPSSSLFQTAMPTWEEEPDHPLPTMVVGKNQPAGQVFNPVVLKEIVLPDGSSYKFSYNVWAEIDRVIYPTNAYDKYEYEATITELEGYSQPYSQAQRNIKKRLQSENGTGSDHRVWKFYESGMSYGAGTPLDDGTLYKKLSIVAPNNTRTEIYKVEQGYSPPPFGLADSRVGQVIQKKVFSSSPDGLGGTLLRRDITRYEETVNSFNYPTTCYNTTYNNPISARRNARSDKAVTILFEGTGSALAYTTHYAYDTTHQATTGVDAIVTSMSHFTPVDNSTAQNGTIGQIPFGTLAKSIETTYLNGTTYRQANILGLPTGSTTRNGYAPFGVVSKTTMVYDECPQYCVTWGRGLPTSLKTWDSSKGNDPDNVNYQAVTHAKFDEYGNRIETTDAKGYTTITTFDTTYNTFPVKVTAPIPDPNPSQNPDGLPHGSQSAFETETVYDTPVQGFHPLGFVVSTKDANGQITTMEYDDPLLRPTRTVAPNGHQTITEYGSGTSEVTRWVKVRAQIDATRWSEGVTKYDGLGRTYFSRMLDSAGNIATRTEFDNMGRVLRSSNPYRVDSQDNPVAGETIFWTTQEYDDLGRTEKVTAADDSFIQTSYGLSTSGVIGTTKTVIDQAGRERTGITDGLGNMVRIYEGPVIQNLFTDYTFDTLGNLRKTLQGEQSRYFLYDSLGRVLFAKQPEQDTNAAFVATDPVTNNQNWSVKYTYDDNGNILATTDSRGVSTTGSYDRLDRLIARNYSDSTPDVGFFYDGAGLPSIPNFSKGKTTKIASSVSETRNTGFDLVGRLSASEQRTTSEQLAGTQPPYSFSYVYNLSGALIEETYPSGRVVRNTISADADLSTVQSKKTQNLGFVTYADNFAYNASGSVTKMQLGNGRWETVAYDPKRLQATKIGLGATSGDQKLLKLEFKFATSESSLDNNGSMREQKITVPTVGSNPGFTATQTYTYDSLNRLESATESTSSQTWKQTFSYDRYGNRRFNTQNGNTTTIPTGCSAAICNPDIGTDRNRLSTSQGYQYDPAGSITQDAAGQRFLYDAESHQTAFFNASNQTTAPDAIYEYDGEGRRVKKTVGNEVTVFVYDGVGQLAAEYSTSITSVQDAKVSYLTTDHVVSPRIVTDQKGAVVSRKDFTAFGEEVISPERLTGVNGNGYVPPSVRQDFTGYQKDSESGLEFAQARYYNTGHGRFTSVDPLSGSGSIRNPQTLNRYSYGLNSPYKFVDPLGLMSVGTTSATGYCSAEYGSCSSNNFDPFSAEKELQNRQTRRKPPPEKGRGKDAKSTGGKTKGPKKASKPKVTVKNITAFTGTFPASSGPNLAGQQAVNANGTAAVQAYGFALSVEYGLTDGGAPVSGAEVVEEVSGEITTVVKDAQTGQIENQTAKVGFAGPVMSGKTSADGSFTDAPLGANSDTPVLSASLTQKLYIKNKDGSRQLIATNTIKATVDLKFTNNKHSGTGKVTVTISSGGSQKSVTFGPPKKVR